MRVGSNTLFDNNVANLSMQQTRLFLTQQQISSGRRLLTASDDPVAAARALEISQADGQNTQFTANRTAARHTVSLAESVLQSVTTLIQDVKAAAAGAGNGIYTDRERQSVATELSGRLDELIGLANSTDGAGNYLFAGYQTQTQPFANTPAGVGYLGDDGQRSIQVNATRQMPSSVSGAEVFMRIRNGNGTFATQASATNAGSGVISSGTVVNPALMMPGESYQVDFLDNGLGGVDYSVTNTTTGAQVIAAQPYVSGQAISFDGIQFEIRGTPAVGDSFTVAPSSNESVFKTLSDMVAALNAPILPGDAVGKAKLSNSLNKGSSNLDNALDAVLTARASLGLRLNEIDALQTAGDDLGIQYRQTLASLQEVDYNKAISDLAQQQLYLTAAQKSFSQVMQLSMFNYM